jgi:hypothetical protein
MLRCDIGPDTELRRSLEQHAKGESLVAGIWHAGSLVDYRVQYTVANRGPGTVKHVVLKVHAMALRQGDNVIWDPERTVDLGDLTEGQVISSDILVMIPAEEPSRVVGIVSGENADLVQASTPDFVAGM